MKRIGHFRVHPGLCIKTRLSAQPLIWKWFFTLMQIKLIFTRKVEYLASFWKWGFMNSEVAYWHWCAVHIYTSQNSRKTGLKKAGKTEKTLQKLHYIKSWIMPSYLYLKKFPHDQQNSPCILMRLCVLYTSLYKKRNKKVRNCKIE